jgi:hypothetical protein
MSNESIADMLMCVNSALVSCNTATAIKDKFSGPDRSLLDGFSGAMAARHINDARKHLDKARQLLEPVVQSARARQTA